MDDALREEMFEYCYERVGEALRSVYAFSLAGMAIEPSVLFVRDDVRADYAADFGEADPDLEDVARQVVEEVVMQSIGSDWLEHLYRFGDNYGLIRVFEPATVVHWWQEDGGLSMSWDNGKGVDAEGILRQLNAIERGQETG